MDYKINIEADSCGSSFMGDIDISYDELVEEFGEPCESDGYKTDAEWVLEFDDGKVATIYNYKDGQNYNGNSGLPTDEIRDWHIGGREQDVVKRVYQIFNRICVNG